VGELDLGAIPDGGMGGAWQDRFWALHKGRGTPRGERGRGERGDVPLLWVGAGPSSVWQ